MLGRARVGRAVLAGHPLAADLGSLAFLRVGPAMLKDPVVVTQRQPFDEEIQGAGVAGLSSVSTPVRGALRTSGRLLLLSRAAGTSRRRTTADLPDLIRSGRGEKRHTCRLLVWTNGGSIAARHFAHGWMEVLSVDFELKTGIWDEIA